MNNKLYVCPSCGNSAIGETWDEHTKEIGHYDNIMSITASNDDMIDQEPTFYCPNCNEEINGLDVQVKEQ